MMMTTRTTTKFSEQESDDAQGSESGLMVSSL
jgi:hypothetical protein